LCKYILVLLQFKEVKKILSQHEIQLSFSRDQEQREKTRLVLQVAQGIVTQDKLEEIKKVSKIEKMAQVCSETGVYIVYKLEVKEPITKSLTKVISIIQEQKQ
jgi:hypothetical protein